MPCEDKQDQMAQRLLSGFEMLDLEQVLLVGKAWDAGATVDKNLAGRCDSEL